MSEELPSINDFVEDRSNLPSVESFAEDTLYIKEEKEVLTEDFVPHIVEEQSENTSLIVNLIESVRDSIPQVKSYDKELYDIVKLIEEFKSDIDRQKQLEEFAGQKRDNEINEQYRKYDQEIIELRGSIPFVPEVKYYDNEIREIKEDILNLKFDDDKIYKLQEDYERVKGYDDDIKFLKDSVSNVKNKDDLDHRWITNTIQSIDENFDTVTSSLSTIKGKLEMEIQDIAEAIETKAFEYRIDIKNLNQKDSDIENSIIEQKNKIYDELRETSLKIWSLHKEFKNDDEELQRQIDHQYQYLKESISDVVSDSDKKFSGVDQRYDEINKFFNNLTEQVNSLPEVKYYDKDISKVNRSITTVKSLVEELEKKLDKQIDQVKEDIKEGLLNIPPNLDNVDPLTPLDQNFATLDDLSNHYRLFMNRIQTQLATLGGGGAVWLWDLDDVNIGIPNNGTYPIIQDNDVLKFDSATSKWVAGPVTSVGSSDLPLSGGTMTGDINFNAGQQFPGTLELAGGTMTGEIGFTTQQTFPGALATTGGTMIGTITFDSSQAFPGTFSPTDGGNISGDTTYTGSTIGTTSLQTRNSVNSLIANQVSGGFSFIGTTNVVTDSPGAGVTGGDFYINTAAGVANVNWTGIAGLTIAADQLIIYSNNDTRWFAGAVEDNSTYLQKSGGTMTGPITLEADAFFTKKRDGQGNKDFIIEGTTVTSLGDTEAQLFFVNRNGINANPDAINYDGLTTNDENVQNRKSVQALITSNNNSFLRLDGGTMTGTLNTDEVVVPRAKTLTIKRGNSNTAIGGIDIKGYAYNDFQVETDIFAVSYGNGSTVGDSINYKGKTDGTNNIQNKASVDAAISAAIAGDGNLLRGGTVKSTGGAADNSGTIDIYQTSLAGSGQLNIFNSSDEAQIQINPGFGITFGYGVFDSNPKTIFFDTSASSGAFFQVNNSGKFHWKDLSNDFMSLNASSLTVNSPAVFSGSAFTVNRGIASGSNTTNFRLLGMLSGGGAINSTLVSIKRSSGQGDTLQYFGLTNTNNNTVQTKASVEALITANAMTTGSWAFINSGTGTGSTLDGFYLVEYMRRTDGDAYLVTILVNAEDSSDNIAVNDVICKLPAGYRPGVDATGMSYTPIFQLTNTESHTATASCMVKADGSITFIEVNGSSKKFYGQCTFNTRTTD